MQNKHSLCCKGLVSFFIVISYTLTPYALADGMSIQSTNSALQNSIIQSSNSGPVEATGKFINATITGGEYNAMSVSAAGVSVSAGNSVVNAQSVLANSSTSTISGLSISTQNTGAVTANGTFQNASIAGGHNSMSVQAVGSSVSVSNSSK